MRGLQSGFGSLTMDVVQHKVWRGLSIRRYPDSIAPVLHTKSDESLQGKKVEYLSNFEPIGAYLARVL
jgi:hypothetical protein